MSVVAIIPARYASSRLPGKPLLAETGKPLVIHVAERAEAAAAVSLVAIATDDARIADAAEASGRRAVMTDPGHESGTERVAEAARILEDEGARFDVVLNVQGDEPELNPDDLDALAAAHRASGAFASTLACPFPADAVSGPGSPADPNCVKAVLRPWTENVLEALYFTRSLAPYPRDAKGSVVEPTAFHLHLGVYAFSPESLQRFAAAPPSLLERTERLEQLRILEMGERIAVAKVKSAAPGIDTSGDYAAFVARCRGS
ncbi:MAG: 3-deoxy-manno-octulosonate cytidylyltransferase [Pseudomonadota bacterium]